LENSEFAKQYLLIGNITSHGRLRETFENTVEQAYMELSGGKWQGDGELHCMSSASSTATTETRKN
jgi:hypothetical protein